MYNSIQYFLTFEAKICSMTHYFWTAGFCKWFIIPVAKLIVLRNKFGAIRSLISLVRTWLQISCKSIDWNYCRLPNSCISFLLLWNLCSNYVLHRFNSEMHKKLFKVSKNTIGTNILIIRGIWSGDLKSKELKLETLILQISQYLKHCTLTLNLGPILWVRFNAEIIYLVPDVTFTIL